MTKTQTRKLNNAIILDLIGRPDRDTATALKDVDVCLGDEGQGSWSRFRVVDVRPAHRRAAKVLEERNLDAYQIAHYWGESLLQYGRKDPAI